MSAGLPAFSLDVAPAGTCSRELAAYRRARAFGHDRASAAAFAGMSASEAHLIDREEGFALLHAQENAR